MLIQNPVRKSELDSEIFLSEVRLSKVPNLFVLSRAGCVLRGPAGACVPGAGADRLPPGCPLPHLSDLLAHVGPGHAPGNNKSRQSHLAGKIGIFWSDFFRVGMQQTFEQFGYDESICTFLDGNPQHFWKKMKHFSDWRFKNCCI